MSQKLTLLSPSAVDSLLDPVNRLHMSVEEQLKGLLDKLDVVTSMKGSGARTRRIRLLRREINNVRYRQGQHHRHSLLNGDVKEEDEDKADAEKSSSDKGGGIKSTCKIGRAHV